MASNGRQPGSSWLPLILLTLSLGCSLTRGQDVFAQDNETPVQTTGSISFGNDNTVQSKPLPKPTVSSDPTTYTVNSKSTNDGQFSAGWMDNDDYKQWKNQNYAASSNLVDKALSGDKKCNSVSSCEFTIDTKPDDEFPYHIVWKVQKVDDGKDYPVIDYTVRCENCDIKADDTSPAPAPSPAVESPTIAPVNPPALPPVLPPETSAPSPSPAPVPSPRPAPSPSPAPVLAPSPAPPPLEPVPPQDVLLPAGVTASEVAYYTTKVDGDNKLEQMLMLKNGSALVAQLSRSEDGSVVTQFNMYKGASTKNSNDIIGEVKVTQQANEVDPTTLNVMITNDVAGGSQLDLGPEYLVLPKGVAADTVVNSTQWLLPNGTVFQSYELANSSYGITLVSPTGSQATELREAAAPAPAQPATTSIAASNVNVREVMYGPANIVNDVSKTYPNNNLPLSTTNLMFAAGTYGAIGNDLKLPVVFLPAPLTGDQVGRGTTLALQNGTYLQQLALTNGQSTLSNIAVTDSAATIATAAMVGVNTATYNTDSYPLPNAPVPIVNMLGLLGQEDKLGKVIQVPEYLPAGLDRNDIKGGVSVILANTSTVLETMLLNNQSSIVSAIIVADPNGPVTITTYTFTNGQIVATSTESLPLDKLPRRLIPLLVTSGLTVGTRVPLPPQQLLLPNGVTLNDLQNECNYTVLRFTDAMATQLAQLKNGSQSLVVVKDADGLVNVTAASLSNSSIIGWSDILSKPANEVNNATNTDVYAFMVITGMTEGDDQNIATADLVIPAGVTTADLSKSVVYKLAEKQVIEIMNLKNQSTIMMVFTATDKEIIVTTTLFDPSGQCVYNITQRYSFLEAGPAIIKLLVLCGIEVVPKCKAGLDSNGQQVYGAPMCRFVLEDQICCSDLGIVSNKTWTQSYLACTEYVWVAPKCVAVSGPAGPALVTPPFQLNPDWERYETAYSFVFNWEDSDANYQGPVNISLPFSGTSDGCKYKLAQMCRIEYVVVDQITDIAPVSFTSLRSPALQYFNLIPFEAGENITANVFDNFVWEDPAEAGVCQQQSPGMLSPTFFAGGWANYSDGYQVACNASLAEGAELTSTEELPVLVAATSVGT